VTFRQVFYPSEDGLRLAARDYDNRQASLTVLCLHGLTRNAADFEDLAAHLHTKYRVIAADQRGRGRSAWDADPMNYVLPTYVRDMWTLLDHLRLDRVAVVGTSMGGMMAMVMAATRPTRVRGILLNDIGPDIDPRGIARIQGYVGQQPPVAGWDEAAARIRAANAAAFPDFGEADWLRFARRTFRARDDGTLEPAYDPDIAVPFRAAPAGDVDLWALFEAASATPCLVIRGALSDILAGKTLAKMAARHPDLTHVTIPARGHAPTLDEPQAVAAIDAFLARLDS